MNSAGASDSTGGICFGLLLFEQIGYPEQGLPNSVDKRNADQQPCQCHLERCSLHFSLLPETTSPVGSVSELTEVF